MISLRFAALPIIGLVIAGCPTSRPPGEPDGSTGGDGGGAGGGADGGLVAPPDRCVPGTAPVDLLFMVDNSMAMGEEQASLVAALPRMLDIFATGDLDGDGTSDVPAVTDMHVGVITSDMGTGGIRVPSCPAPELGDDGVLRRHSSEPGCRRSYPSFLTYTGPKSTTDIAADLACRVRTGTGGCNFEQQLEAVLKAVTPSSAPVYTGPLPLRCFTYEEALHPLSRYVDGLLALRADPANIVFTLIAGVPGDLLPDEESPDFDAILMDPRMDVVVDPSAPTAPVPSCSSPLGDAYPPRRMVETAQQLDAAGAHAIVQSICQEDYTPALRALAARIAGSITTACL